jgi:hypothetical protein
MRRFPLLSAVPPYPRSEKRLSTSQIRAESSKPFRVYLFRDHRRNSFRIRFFRNTPGQGWANLSKIPVAENETASNRGTDSC